MIYIYVGGFTHSSQSSDFPLRSAPVDTAGCCNTWQTGAQAGHRGCIPFFWLDLSCCLHWCKNLWWNQMWNPCFCRHLSVSSIPDIYLIWHMAMVPPFWWFSNLHKSLEDFPMRAAGLITLMSIGFKTEIRPVNGRAEKAAHIKGTSTCGVRHVLFVGRTKM